MPTQMEMAEALLTAYSSEREIVKQVGPDGCVTLRLRGPEGEPSWILGAEIKANFQGSEEEAAKFQEQLSGTLSNIQMQVEFQSMLKSKLGLT